VEGILLKYLIVPELNYSTRAGSELAPDIISPDLANGCLFIPDFKV